MPTNVPFTSISAAALRQFREAAAQLGVPILDDAATVEIMDALRAQAEEITETFALLEERGSVYGDAWLLTGTALNDLPLGHLFASPYGFNWIMILNKLHRILHSPAHKDSWMDIQGYAQLAIDHIEATWEANDEPLP